MKKLLLAATFAATFSLSAIAADGSKKYGDDVKNVSYQVLSQFSSDFGDAENVTWTITPTSQKATFSVDGVQKTAFYNLMGTYLGLTEEVAYKAIPALAKKAIAHDYKDYTIGQIIKFETGESDLQTTNAFAVDQPEALVYFVDLKKADSEVLVRVSARGSVYFFKQIK